MDNTMNYYELLYTEIPSLQTKEFYNFYNKFNSVLSHDANNGNACEFSHIIESVRQNVKDLYKQLNCNLKFLYDDNNTYFKNMKAEKTRYCFYLKYWFHDRIIHENKKEQEVKIFLKDWTKIKNKLINVTECNFINMNSNEFILLKKVYDLLLFYDKYDKNLNISNDEISGSKYCSYISEANIFYQFIKSKCDNAEDEANYCPEYLKYIKEYIDSDRLSLLECKSEKKDIVLTDSELNEYRDIIQSDTELTSEQKIQLLNMYERKPTNIDSLKSSTNATITTLGTLLGMFSIIFLFFKVYLHSFIIYGYFMKKCKINFYM
ncbi:variable surface protein, partial [Plasmodium gonderi]